MEKFDFIELVVFALVILGPIAGGVVKNAINDHRQRRRDAMTAVKSSGVKPVSAPEVRPAAAPRPAPEPDNRRTDDMTPSSASAAVTPASRRKTPHPWRRAVIASAILNSKYIQH